MTALSHTPELAAEICDRLAKGESLRSVCRDLHMPDESTVRYWVVEDINGFAAQYARARDVALDIMADDTIAIADDGSNDWMESNDPENPGYRVNGEHQARSRLRVDTRKWYVSKLAPKRYGDRLAHEVSGPEGGPIKHEVTDERRAALTLALLGAIGSPLLGQRADGQPAVGAGAGESPAA